MQKFVADAMLGRLARWMRYLGYDVLYFRDIDDKELVKISRAEGRVLLTRDRGIPERFRVNCYLLRSQNFKEQIVEIIQMFPVKGPYGRRCINCNELLKEVLEKEDIKEMVPEFVYINHNSFHQCPSCGRVYWEGSHIKNMESTIKRLCS